MKVAIFLASALLVQATGWAQVSARVVRATGESTVSVKPDQVQVNIGVVTEGATAQDAAALNASRMDALLATLKEALGAGGETRTVNYSITPNYKYATGQPPVLTGFTASNTVEATTPDLARAGSIIDAAAKAGASNITGLRFTLKNDEAARGEALAAAARQARTNAQAIATGLGGRLGAVLSAQEGAVSSIVPLDARATTAVPTTPIESGFVQVRAVVTVDIELIQ
ncbi:MAG TPA: SIMPL domain-containing protein [Bryobacteraceae bacterium]|nr:SIMPL domain-containing protein [Bryobacteraceae bacterium]